MPIQLLIADDHQVILDGFTSIFESIPDINVVATCRNGQQVLDFLAIQKVNVVLLDINMPIMNGVETCKKISRSFNDVKVIALSMYDQQSYFKRMLQYGALGYLLKDDSTEEIVRGIRAVHQGSRYISNQLKDRLADLDYLLGKKSYVAIEISERELEILELLSQGLTDPQIGEKLFISYHTAKTHRKNLLSKFNAKNSSELIKMALEKGFI